MTEQELAELDALANAATPGPWGCTDEGEYGVFVEEFSTFVAECLGRKNYAMTNAAFIAAARTAVPELIAEVRRLWGLLYRCVPYLEHLPDCGSICDGSICVGYPCDCSLGDIMAEIRGLATAEDC